MLRMANSWQIPSVTEAQNLFIRGHNVQKQAIFSPSTDDAVVAAGLRKAQTTQFVFKTVIISQTRGIHYPIHIQGGPRFYSSLIRD